MIRTIVSAMLMTWFLVAVGWCAGAPGGPPETQASSPAGNVGGLDAAPGTGTIVGVVRFKGDKPDMKPIAEIAGNAFCKHCYDDGPPPRQEFVLGRHETDDTLANVLVYVSKGLEGKTFAPPDRAAVVDQVGCMYVPHVVGVMAGQPVEFRNSDATLHNVMAMPRQNPPFNFGMPGNADPVRRTFTKPEMKLNLHCFMHPWMSGYVHVLPHPFFAVTEGDGTFTIRGLPPGEYEVSVLHESALAAPDRAAISVKVAAGATAQADFTYRLAKSK